MPSNDVLVLVAGVCRATASAWSEEWGRCPAGEGPQRLGVGHFIQTLEKDLLTGDAAALFARQPQTTLFRR